MLLRFALVLLLAACDGAKPDPCISAAGDAAQPIELQAVTLDASGTIRPLRDGDAVLLQRPPQGGYVIYAGAAARNLMPCGATVTAYLIDRASGNALTNLDQRRIDFTSAAGAFWQTSQPYSQTPNIPSCPDALHAGIVGRDATLHVQVTDAQARSATVDVRVIASCAGDAACACICGPDPGHC